jgi:hypothetical protein
LKKNGRQESLAIEDERLDLRPVQVVSDHGEVHLSICGVRCSWRAGSYRLRPSKSIVQLRVAALADVQAIEGRMSAGITDAPPQLFRSPIPVLPVIQERLKGGHGRLNEIPLKVGEWSV